LNVQSTKNKLCDKSSLHAEISYVLRRINRLPKPLETCAPRRSKGFELFSGCLYITHWSAAH